MNGQRRNWRVANIVVLLSMGRVVCAQDTQTTSPAGEVAQPNPVAPCIQPPPLIGWQDYNGPLAKVVGTFGRKLERKTVHPPHYKPGAVLCSLEPGAKFLLFLHDSGDPVSFLSAGFNGALDQASNKDPAFGQGSLGYTKRFGDRKSVV